MICLANYILLFILLFYYLTKTFLLIWKNRNLDIKFSVRVIVCFKWHSVKTHSLFSVKTESSASARSASWHKCHCETVDRKKRLIAVAHFLPKIDDYQGPHVAFNEAPLIWRNEYIGLFSFRRSRFISFSFYGYRCVPVNFPLSFLLNLISSFLSWNWLAHSVSLGNCLLLYYSWIHFRMKQICINIRLSFFFSLPPTSTATHVCRGSRGCGSRCARTVGSCVVRKPHRRAGMEWKGKE